MTPAEPLSTAPEQEGLKLETMPNGADTLTEKSVYLDRKGRVKQVHSQNNLINAQRHIERILAD